MKLKEIALDKLSISKLNMRAKDKNPDLSDILPSIRENGVQQTLLVRPEGGGFGVVAGRRRYYALLEIAKETGQKLKAPCGILETNDDAIAIEASIIENMARLPATELEQFAAFKRLKTAGRSVSEIAHHFGVTELKVKRILALANLKPQILKLYENGDIDFKAVRLLTMASQTKQAEWLKLAKDEQQETPTGWWLKEWIMGEEQISTQAALFDLKDYKGAILTDLFGEEQYFADPDMFWSLQNTKIAEAITEYEADGWQVELMERGQGFHSYGYSKRPKEAGGKVFISVGNDGAVAAHLGYLTHEDAKKIQAILTGEDDKPHDAAPKAKPEMSGPLKDYVALHRHSAIRASLLSHPMVALRLATAHMLVGSPLWSVAPQKTETRKEQTNASLAASQGTSVFEAERAAVYDLIGISQADNNYCPTKKLAKGDLTDIFACLLTLEDADVMRVLSFAMAESLAAGTEIVEAIPYAVPVNMGALWQPDDAFFDILREKKVINAMVKDIAGKRAADANLTETGKVQKAIIRECLDASGSREPRPDWRPKWMQVPAQSYLDKATCPPALASSYAAKRMADTQPETPKQVA